MDRTGNGPAWSGRLVQAARLVADPGLGRDLPSFQLQREFDAHGVGVEIAIVAAFEFEFVAVLFFFFLLFQEGGLSHSS